MGIIPLKSTKLWPQGAKYRIGISLLYMRKSLILKLIDKKNTLFMFVLLISLFLEGCGKKGSPTVPVGEEDLFPAFYPLVEDSEEPEEKTSQS